MGKEQDKKQRRLSLHPLKFEEVISDVLKVKPGQKSKKTRHVISAKPESKLSKNKSK